MSRLARSFLVRAARWSDVAAMPALEQSAGELFRVVPDLAHLADGENRSEQLYGDLVAGGWCRVAENDAGELCGFLCAERHEADLHICELAVGLDHQRLGIGRRLIGVTIQAARHRGIASVTLTTFADIAWNAPFYERLGFRRLADRALGPRLRAVLRREAESGLPIERRCAMRLALVSNDDVASDATG
jgi:ribosomal protein S18 acetylase RimI-like enzyme